MPDKSAKKFLQNTCMNPVKWKAKQTQVTSICAEKIKNLGAAQ